MPKGFPLVKRVNGKRYFYAHVARRHMREAKRIADNMRNEGWNIHIAKQKSQSFNFDVYRLYKRRKK